MVTTKPEGRAKQSQGKKKKIYPSAVQWTLKDYEKEISKLLLFEQIACAK